MRFTVFFAMATSFWISSTPAEASYKDAMRSATEIHQSDLPPLPEKKPDQVEAPIPENKPLTPKEKEEIKQRIIDNADNIEDLKILIDLLSLHPAILLFIIEINGYLEDKAFEEKHGIHPDDIA